MKCAGSRGSRHHQFIIWRRNRDHHLRQNSNSYIFTIIEGKGRRTADDPLRLLRRRNSSLLLCNIITINILLLLICKNSLNIEL